MHRPNLQAHIRHQFVTRIHEDSILRTGAEIRTVSLPNNPALTVALHSPASTLPQLRNRPVMGRRIVGQPVGQLQASLGRGQ